MTAEQDLIKRVLSFDYLPITNIEDSQLSQNQFRAGVRRVGRITRYWDDGFSFLLNFATDKMNSIIALPVSYKPNLKSKEQRKKLTQALKAAIGNPAQVVYTRPQSSKRNVVQVLAICNQGFEGVFAKGNEPGAVLTLIDNESIDAYLSNH